MNTKEIWWVSFNPAVGAEIRKIKQILIKNYYYIMMLHVSQKSLYKCIRNWTYNQNNQIIDLSNCITIGKYYCLSNQKPCSEYVINIIDDTNYPHDINKNMFVDIQELRETKLKQIGIK